MFITRKLEERIPLLEATDLVADLNEKVVPVKLFSPYSILTSCIAELDPETGTCFGLVDGLETGPATLT